MGALFDCSSCTSPSHRQKCSSSFCLVSHPIGVWKHFSWTGDTVEHTDGIGGPANQAAPNPSGPIGEGVLTLGPPKSKQWMWWEARKISGSICKFGMSLRLVRDVRSLKDLVLLSAVFIGVVPDLVGILMYHIPRFDFFRDGAKGPHMSHHYFPVCAVLFPLSSLFISLGVGRKILNFSGYFRRVFSDSIGLTNYWPFSK